MNTHQQIYTTAITKLTHTHTITIWTGLSEWYRPRLDATEWHI